MRPMDPQDYQPEPDKDANVNSGKPAVAPEEPHIKTQRALGAVAPYLLALGILGGLLAYSTVQLRNCGMDSVSKVGISLSGD